MDVNVAMYMNSATLTFGLGPNLANNDLIAVKTGCIVAGHNTVDIDTNGDSRLTVGTYTLITAQSGLGTQDIAFSYLSNGTAVNTETVNVGGSFLQSHH